MRPDESAAYTVDEVRLLRAGFVKGQVSYGASLAQSVQRAYEAYPAPKVVRVRIVSIPTADGASRQYQFVNGKFYFREDEGSYWTRSTQTAETVAQLAELARVPNEEVDAETGAPCL